MGFILGLLLGSMLGVVLMMVLRMWVDAEKHVKPSNRERPSSSADGDRKCCR